MRYVYLGVVLAPLLASIIAGLFGRSIGRAGAHWVTIIGVGIAFILSSVAFNYIVFDGGEVFNGAVYTWLVSGDTRLVIGFLIDRLSVTMMVVVSFVSWVIHIYTIGYMHDDPGYQRFFSYTALFTFFMLILVMANNFLQLLFGWEGVGLVSYLLIGFWFKRESANQASVKAFLANRIGDFGFVLGIAAIMTYFHTLDYAQVFQQAPLMANTTIELLRGTAWPLMTVICVLLFIGAMGKSAQVPLHVWLPDSMEGPTPISALIHAATMVTAGIFMVARMSPLYELSATALSLVLVVGAIGAFFIGVLGVVQHDIKRVIAYSTISQLGYMAAALGASAFSAGIFHLVTHAFFKALLFLAAGSIIIAMHHEQDMRKMGGLGKYMPITWITMVIGGLALSGVPGTAGFFSKDAIIDAVGHSNLPGAGFAHVALLVGVFVTALYTFRLIFLVFHGPERFGAEVRKHVHESQAVVIVPLIVLAIPSLMLGAILVGPMLYEGHFGHALLVLPQYDVLAQMGEDYHGPWALVLHGLIGLPFIFALLGFGVAWYCYIKRPDIPKRAAERAQIIYNVLVHKYGFDEFYESFFAGGARGVGNLFWRVGDVALIDGLAVNGSARAVGWFSSIVRTIQSGFLYHYAFAMIIGLLLLLAIFVHGIL
ncbi:MAG: NADH-quinone oxidoreductase subunit L [Gammaproteobacteria bacterium]|nr:NADH-quinone oxidoreductase subunit L [Gammaproteobacteria bacterium]MCI0590444.1 NADH-quinone oxidoreductase subunit L [Gammaproteobacteria bacterium]